MNLQESNLPSVAEFTHSSIKDPFGLQKISICGRISYYRCELCNQDYTGDGNIPRARSRFIDHAKSKRHNTLLLHSQNSRVTCVFTKDREHDPVSAPAQPDEEGDDYVGEDSFSFDDQSLGIGTVEDISDSFIPSSYVPMPTSHNVSESSTIMMQRILEDTFGTDSYNFIYYFHQYLRNGSGLKSLIAYSLLDNYKLFNDINEHSVHLHFDILKMASSLSTKQRSTLSQVFCSLIASYRELCAYNTVNPSNQFHVPVPISDQEIRNNYMRGPKSMWRSLPCPTVISSYSIDETKKITYACVRVKDCVAHFLANGGVLMPTEELCTAAKSKMSTMSLLADETVLFVKIWSDSFEPNNIKQNRGRGIWAVTLTIVAKGTHHVISEDFNYTFPLGICFSRYSSIQDAIFYNIIEDINQLFTKPTTYFYAHTNNMIKVRVAILVITMDQPERRKRNYVLMGNSKPSNRWGYLVNDFDCTSRLLPCCERCFNRLKEDTWDYVTDCVTMPCESCYRWDCSLNAKTQKLSNQYLLESLNELNTKMKEESLSLAQLKRICNGKGLNESAAAHIYDHHHNVRTKEMLLAKDEESKTEAVHKRIIDKMTGPKYEMWSGSPLWASLSHDFDDIVDSPMHLLFLGVVKSTMSYVSEFLKLRKVSHCFENLMKHKLRCILDEYKIHWMVLIDFKQGGDILDTTGWLAENFVGFSRLFLWFVSSLRVIGDNRSFLPIDPVVNDNIQLWSKAQLLDYTEEYNLPIIRNEMVLKKRKQANVIELRSSVREFKRRRETVIQQDNISESNIPRNNCTVEDIISLVGYLHKLIYSIMGKGNGDSTSTRNDIERFSRLYLSQLSKVTTNMGIDNVHTRLWNLQSLLNLGRMFERYGHIPLYWEGGIAGEAIIKKFKREKGSLSLKESLKHIMESLYRRRSLEYLNTASPMDMNSTVEKRVHVYSSIHEVNKKISLHHPISVLWNKSAPCHYVCIRNKKGLRYIIIRTKDITTDDIGKWFSIHLIKDEDKLYDKEDSSVEMGHEKTKLITDVHADIPHMMLPSVHLSSKCYTTISSLW
jgi:hypothetical protein